MKISSYYVSLANERTSSSAVAVEIRYNGLVFSLKLYQACGEAPEGLKILRAAYLLASCWPPFHCRSGQIQLFAGNTEGPLRLSLVNVDFHHSEVCPSARAPLILRRHPRKALSFMKLSNDELMAICPNVAFAPTPKSDEPRAVALWKGSNKEWQINLQSKGLIRESNGTSIYV